jgi:hypothetical protein
MTPVDAVDNDGGKVVAFIDIAAGAKAVATLIEQQAATIAERDERIEALELALEPFSNLAGGDVNMNDPLRKWFTVAQLNEARATLERTKQP